MVLVFVVGGDNVKVMVQALAICLVLFAMHLFAFCHQNLAGGPIIGEGRTLCRLDMCIFKTVFQLQLVRR